MSTLQNIKKRNGEIVQFNISNIEKVIKKAFLASRLDENEPVAKSIAGLGVGELEYKVLVNEGMTPTVEQIQDIVERHLMSASFFDVAKKYIIYRYEHEKIREQEKFKTIEMLEEGILYILKRNGKKQKFDVEKIRKTLAHATTGFTEEQIKCFDVESVLEQMKVEVFEEMNTKDIEKILIMNLRSMIELDPVYSKIASRVLLSKVYKQVFGGKIDFSNTKNAMK